MPLQDSRKAAFVSLLLLGVPACALADDKPLPAAIAAPGETVVLKVHAIGLQYYDCKPGTDGKLAWTFNSPQATLMVNDKVVGHHAPGPTWELADGSSITAKTAGNAPGAGPKDVAWLKLEVNSHKGSGQLSDVATVQRINTVGGVLKGACDNDKLGRGMPYSADYVFLRKS